jgi:hypothetical protein
LNKLIFFLSIFKGRDQPDAIKISDLIPGLALALKEMKVGEKREIFIHPAFAYGENSNMDPNLSLIARVELLKIFSQGEQNDEGLPKPLELASINKAKNSLQNQYEKIRKQVAFQLGAKTWKHFEKGQVKGYSLDSVIHALKDFQKEKNLSKFLEEYDSLLSQLHWEIYQVL